MRILNFLYPYIKKNKKNVVAYIIVTCILWGIGIFSPFLLGLYIDILVEKRTSNVVVKYIIIIAIVELADILAQYLGSYISTKINNKILYDITNDIFQKIFRIKLSEYKKVDNSYMIDQITTDAANVVSFFSNNLTNIFLQGCTIIFSGIIVFKSDIILSLIIFSLLPIYILSYIAFKNKLYDANLKFKEETNQYYTKKVEQITKLEFIKRNVLYKEMENRFYAAFSSMYKVAVSQIKTNYIFSNLNQIMFVFCYICVIAIGGYKVLVGEMSIGYLTIISTYFSMIISSATFFLNLAGSYQETKISIDRIEKIKQSDEEMFGEIKISKLDKITIKNLTIKYNEKKVIDNFSKVFEKGKIYVVKGNNGAGKTTLINTMVGLYSDLFEGEILFNNISIKQLDMPYIRRNYINYVEQEPDFLNLSISEYLKFGINKEGSADKRKEDLTALLNMQQYIRKCKEEKKLINEDGSNFSGGEKQKLALIRGLLKVSLLKILDEPTSALDSNSVNNLLDWLKKDKEDITIIITHDKRVLNICDEVIEL